MRTLGPGRPTYGAAPYPGTVLLDPGPHQAYGLPPVSDSEKPLPARRNGLAVASFVVTLATLGIGGLLGAVFALVALLQIRRARRAGTPQRGTGFAVAGLTLAVLFTLVWVVVISSVIGLVQLFFRGEANADPADVTAPVEIVLLDVNPGHCLTFSPLGSSRVIVMPCGHAHTTELLAMLPVQSGPGGAYPGYAQARREGIAACQATLDALPPTSAGLFRPYPLTPTESLWSRDHREVWCFATSRHGALTGRIADDDVALAH